MDYQKGKPMETHILIKDGRGQESLDTGSSDSEIKRQDPAKKHPPESWRGDCKDAYRLQCEADRFGRDDYQEEAPSQAVWENRS